jgi:hypothetical protein
VHLIRFSPAESELVCDGLFYHPNEIWDLKSCPFDHRVFSTVYTSGKERIPLFVTLFLPVHWAFHLVVNF